MTGHAATFAAVFATLYAAHEVGDHWVQTHRQALTKGQPGILGRGACAEHVATLTATKAVMLLAVIAVTGLPVTGFAVCAGLAIDAASHYWADRRTTLAALAHRIRKDGYYALGAPRPGHDDAPTLGTGAYALDQSWHIAWLFVAALIIAAVA